MLTKEKASVIRKGLKAHGWNARQVSVRSPHGSLYITIKDAAVPKSVVERIAQQFETIHRCDYSGEILSGGNTFVFVDYSSEALDPTIARILAAASDEPGRVVDFGGWSLCRENQSWNPGCREYRFWNGADDNGQVCMNLNCAAQRMAEAMLSAV